MSNNDQTAKADAGKIRPSLVSPEFIEGIARIREYGVQKYPGGGKENWKIVDADRFHEAMLRHSLGAWEDWKNIDEESGEPTILHIACNCMFLYEKLLEEKSKNGSKEGDR